MSKKDWMVEKLERLVKLSRATEPDKPSDEELFTKHTTDAYSLLSKVKEDYTNMSYRKLRDVMLQANTIWKIRRMIYNGEDPSKVPPVILEKEIEQFLLNPQGPQKINAIKHYRRNAPIVYGLDKSLKESKEYVDAVYDKLRLEGKIKP